MKFKAPFFFKIDIEGSEYRILEDILRLKKKISGKGGKISYLPHLTVEKRGKKTKQNQFIKKRANWEKILTKGKKYEIFSPLLLFVSKVALFFKFAISLSFSPFNFLLIVFFLLSLFLLLQCVHNFSYFFPPLVPGPYPPPPGGGVGGPGGEG